ncbi:hypothetical protein GRJ2_003444500 [Grus japonensis]|uniref:ribonuclease H n=1 Tax=Grus japonensis TaxID=30415 RepID=A0ABC9YIA1_GRUJA
MPLSHEGAEPISISGVTGGSQQLTVLEAEVSLTGNECEKHPIVTGPEALCILGIDYLRKGYFKDPKGYLWAFGIAALETEEIELLSTFPGLSEDPSVVGLLRVEEQQVPIATTTVHQWQYRTNRDSLVPIHKLIRQLEGQGVISRTHSPFNSPRWPVRKSNGEWRLTGDYRGLNEVTPPMSAAVPDMLELQYELESKAAKWYATNDIANAFFSIPLVAECRAQFAFTWRGIQYTWNRLPQGWKHSPTICHGLVQTALQKGEAPEHLQYIEDIIVWGNSVEEDSEKGKKIIQILLKAGFTIKRNIAAWLEKLVVKVHHVDAHVPKSRATEEHENNQQVVVDLIGITETWWDSSYDWSVGMEGYRLFRKDRQGRRGGGVAHYVNDQLECMDLHLGMDEEPTESLWVRIKGSTGTGDIIVGVCYRPRDQGDRADEALYRQIGAASCSQALVLMGDFNHPDICWRGNTAECKQSRKFLECTDDNFLLQVTEEPTRRGAMLDLILTNKEGLVGDVKLKGGLGCSDHEMVEFRILRAARRARSKLTTLDFRRADFGLFRDLLG